MEQYWDSRFRAEGKIWGESPSRTAEHACLKFLARNVQKVLVLGAGYGRNTAAFSHAGLSVTGVEISGEALRFAQEHDPHTEFIQGSVLDIPPWGPVYDAVYSFNLLHLFRQNDRTDLIGKCQQVLRPGGLAYFTVFSEKETSYGKGASVEPNTFESKPGRPVHYFTEEDLADHFRQFLLIETGLMEDPESHGAEGPHVHVVRYILAER